MASTSSVVVTSERRASTGDRPGEPSTVHTHLWWLCAVFGALVFAVVWMVSPHGRQNAGLWVFALKLLAFGLVSAGVAFFPWTSRRLYPLLFIAFIGYTGYLIPRISYFYYGDTGRTQADSFYTHLYLLVYPGIVLTATAAYRLGGGSSGRCLKIAGTGILLLFSGFLDIMWFVANPVAIPATIDAPHINAITGGPISFDMAILFALAHVPVIIGWNLLPLDRWIHDRLGISEPTVHTGRTQPAPVTAPLTDASTR